MSLLKKKVIASSIQNLTDARYFAGWMVDYVVFSLNQEDPFYIQPNELQVLKGWIEGPQVFLNINPLDYPKAAKFIIDFEVDGIIIPYVDRSKIDNDIKCIYTVNSDVIKDLEVQENEIYIIENCSSLDTIPNHDKVEFFINWTNQRFEESDFLNPKIDGFMVHGSEEEKVGMKTFDELDNFFECIEDF